MRRSGGGEASCFLSRGLFYFCCVCGVTLCTAALAGLSAEEPLMQGMSGGVAVTCGLQCNCARRTTAPRGELEQYH